MANNKRNPLKVDPSRTGMLRRQFEADLYKRFYKLKGDILRLVVDEDVFGLKFGNRLFNTYSVLRNTKFAFMSDPQKVVEFQNWLQTRIDAEILQTSIEKAEDAWLKAYIQKGYEKGAGRAFDDTKKPALASKNGEVSDFYKGTRAEFLRSSFAAPESIEKVKILASRTFMDLKGVTDTMAQQIRRELLDGLVRGQNPNVIARALNDRVDKIGITRARTIARTEIIRAHAEGQLDAFEKLDVVEVGVMVEWSTANDDRVCPLCQALEADVMTIQEARGIIPRHANCRCTWIPANVGEDKKNQRRASVELSKSRNESLKKEFPKATIEEAKKKSRWAGAETKFGLTRPKSVLDVPKSQVFKPKPKKAKKPPKLSTPQTPPAPSPVPQTPKPKPTPTPAPEPIPTPPKPTPPPKTPTGKVPPLSVLKKVKTLPGSTRPDLMEDITTGKQWVMKSVDAGIAPDHLRSEVLADDLYRAMGLDVPKSVIVESAEGPVKLSEFLEGGETLESWLRSASPAAQKEMFEEISKGFVSDALLANHDVAGLSFDNIFIVGGKPYRIDNGGALLYRAQGAPKRGFGKVVEELTSMRDPSINSQTAKVFASVTDDKIDDQIAKILVNREEILNLIPDKSLKDLVASRIDYLEDLRKSRMTPAKKVTGGWKERAKKRLAEPGITKDTPERVIQSRLNGVSISSDRDMVEDATTLVWQEVDENGNKVVRAQLKVNAKGGEAIAKVIGDDLLPNGDNLTLPEDVDWPIILKAAKTVNTHAVDGAYNLTTLSELESVLKDIDDFISKYPDLVKTGAMKANPDVLKMWKTYKKYGEEILEAKNQKKALTKTYEQYKKKPPKADKADLKRLPTRKEEAKFNTSRFDNGRAERITDFNRVRNTDQIVIDVDGVEVKYIPPTSQNVSTDGLALKGNLEMKLVGEVTEENLQKVMRTLNTLGIDSSPPTEEFQELLYLHRSVVLNNDHNIQEYKTIWESTTLSDKEKVEKIKTWAKTRYPDAVFDGPSYNPAGVSGNGFGDGYQYWKRWDIPEEVIEKGMKDYVLTHDPYTYDMSELIDRLLNSGGELTSTVQRIRKGVSVSSTGGMSSDSDIVSGGASYIFTRIKKRSSLSNSGRLLTFKSRNLARQDFISYDSDYYGRLSNIGNRAATIDKLQEYAKGGANETLFKHGLSILDELDTIRVSSKADADKVIDVFKKHKITKMNDGRPIEDVVVVTR